MPLLPDEERRRATAQIMRDLGHRLAPGGTASKAEWRELINAADAWKEANAAAYNQAIPAAIRTKFTADEKALALCYVIMRERGLLRTEEDG